LLDLGGDLSQERAEQSAAGCVRFAPVRGEMGQTTHTALTGQPM